MRLRRGLYTPTALAGLQAHLAAHGHIVVDDAFTGPIPAHLFACATALEAHGADRMWIRRFSAGEQTGSLRGATPAARQSAREAAAAALAGGAGAVSTPTTFDYLRACEVQERQADPLPRGYHFCDVVAVDGPARCALCAFARGLLEGAVWRWCARATGIPLDPSHGVALSLTRYGPGDFLAVHDDVSADPPYRLAFVLYLNPVWASDWGGQLRFEAGGAVRPLANRLVLFSPDAGTRHAVDAVTAQAPVPRFAVSGWYLGARRDPR